MLIADLASRLLVDAPECPDETARQALVDAAAELCRDALVWNEVQDAQVLIDGQPLYDIDAPKDARVTAVLDAWVGARRLWPKTLAELSALMPAWQTETGSEPSFYCSEGGASVLRVFPVPANAHRASLRVRAAYAPALTADALPDALVERHLDAILDGASARLFAQPRKPWSNAELAIYHKAQFMSAKVDARIAVLHDGAPGSLTAQVRPFGF